MGESPAFDDLTAYRPSRLADLVVTLADELRLGRFDFVGWSWGASVGVHLAARHPDRLTTLVLLDAGHTDAQDLPGWQDTSLEERIAEFEADQVSFPDWDAVLAAARERAPAWRPALEERICAGMQERDGVVAPRADVRAMAAALHFLALEPPSSTLPALGKLDLPILLLLASRNDTRAASDRFRAAVPRATVDMLDSEHDLLAQAPDETIRLVADWLLRQPFVA